MSDPGRGLVPLDAASGAALAPAIAGGKAARLAAALRVGLPVLPGWVVPVSAARPALAAAAAAVRESGMAAGRRAVLCRPLDAALAADLAATVTRLGGRVIVRSSSPLESGARWAGAFSSITGVGPGDAATAVRSCWASAFAVDPLERLEASGLPFEALELAVLLQPELVPVAGGTARVAGGHVTVEGVAGHPGPLLSGWADALPDAELTARIGAGAVRDVAGLAAAVRRETGDDVIEWAVSGGQVWLLQSLRSATGPRTGDAGPGAVPAAAGPAVFPADLPVARDRMPLLAAAVQARGRHVPARPAAPGTAAGRLVACRPHERPPDGFRDAVLLVERPVPALAPLLFGARGVIARTGGAGSHLAEVARSLGVPMVTGCRPEDVTGPGVPAGGWLAALDGSSGDVALLRQA